jgi:hypothetical protein
LAYVKTAITAGTLYMEASPEQEDTDDDNACETIKKAEQNGIKSLIVLISVPGFAPCFISAIINY